MRMETPAGLVMIEYNTDNSRQSTDNSKSAKVESVRLTNVASFLHSTDLLSFCSELGELIVDVSYGGNFYAIVDVQKN